MEALKNWLFLIGHKSAINLFLIFVYGSLLMLISFINSHFVSEVRHNLQNLTHAESLAWIFIITIASIVYLCIVFIAKTKITYLFILLNSFGLLWFYFKASFGLNSHSEAIINHVAPTLTTYNIGVLSLFIAIIITLILFKRYHFTLQQRFLHE